jgi:hypothetical protein
MSGTTAALITPPAFLPINPAILSECRNRKSLEKVRHFS